MMNFTTPPNNQIIQQRQQWYNCILNDLHKTKRLSVFDIDSMLDLLNLVKSDIRHLETKAVFALKEERGYPNKNGNIFG